MANGSTRLKRMSTGCWLLLVAFVLLIGCRSDETPPVEPGSADAVKIEVAEEGLYGVSLVDLHTAGLNADTLDADTLRLTDGETAVPVHIQDNTLYFYGQASDSPYTATRTYVLRVGEPGQTMAETAVAEAAGDALTAVTRTLHLEENNLYSSDARSADHDELWFWQELQQQSTLPIEFELDAVANAPAQLRLNLWGFTHNPEVDNDHDFDVLINDQPVGSVAWDGQTFHTAELDIPAGVLQSGTNTILLDNRPEGATFLDIMQLNWVELTYPAPPEAVDNYLAFDTPAAGTLALDAFGDAPLLFDVSTPSDPRLIAAADATAVPVQSGQSIVAVGPGGDKMPAAITPLRTSDWASPDQQADLLIVTTDELAPALEPLVAARAEQGITAVVVPVAELYDTFGGGSATPEAIRNFVAYTQDNWQQPAPQYLFLVGDATSDYRNHLGTNPPNLVPSLMVPVDASGETVSDSRLVDLDDDMMPELAVGRWPVSDVAQVEDLVARTLAYEAGTAANRAVFAADGTESYFEGIADRLASTTLPASTESDILAGPASSEVADALNAGAWLATYIGHGSITQWGKEDVFTLDAVDSLDSQTPPIVLQLTCLTGLFSHPEQTSLSETMLTHENGPVLLVAATSLTYSTHQEPFADAFMTSLQDPAVTRVGDAFQTAKRSLDVSTNGVREVSDTFALFGDPTTVIIRP